MSKVAVGLLASVVLVVNALIIVFLLRGGDGRAARDVVHVADTNATTVPLVEAINELREDVSRLPLDLAGQLPPSSVTVAPATGVAPAVATAPPDSALLARLDEMSERLQGLEKTLAAMKDVNDELVVAKLREKRQEQFRSEDGYTVADELLEQKKFAVGANGILTFLEAHPDHPDTRDLMQKARDAFVKAGYGEKALWLQGEMMRKFPEQRGRDLYSLAMLEKKMRKVDDALRHIEESVELATTDQERMNRMFYHAYLIHQRDGDQAGLAAYREIARLAGAAGVGTPAKEAGKRADEIEARLAGR